MLGKRQCLELMGIEVWVRRALLPPASAARGAAALQPASLPPASAQAAPAARAAPSGATASPAAPPSLAPATPAPASAPPAPGATEAAPAASAGPAPGAEVPRFKLAFVSYGQLGLCLPLKGALPKRFCDSLALALGEKPESGKYQTLEWPVARPRPGFDQSIKVARQAVAEALAALPPRRLVFGEEAQRYCPPQTEEGEARLEFLPELETLLASADQKRRLWRQLQGS